MLIDDNEDGRENRLVRMRYVLDYMREFQNSIKYPPSRTLDDTLWEIVCHIFMVDGPEHNLPAWLVSPQTGDNTNEE